MKINIVSADERYKAVNELLLKNGYNSRICTSNTLDKCDYLLLSVRNELSDGELVSVFSKIDANTVVLSGNKKRIRQFFEGQIIDYSEYEEFLQKNAYLTAEATVSYLHSLTKDSLCGVRIFVSGYGRIGKQLCRFLKEFGSEVFVYARREEIKAQINKDGYTSVPLDKGIRCDIIVNTVPYNIFSAELTALIPKEAYIVELASPPYGFENMSRVSIASGLPGKLLPRGGAQAVFDTVYKILSKAGKE